MKGGKRITCSEQNVLLGSLDLGAEQEQEAGELKVGSNNFNLRI